MVSQKQKFKKVFEKLTANKYIHESTVRIENTGGDFSYHLEHGGKKTDSLILTASITKLFTSTCIFMLREQEKLSLDDKVANYLEDDTLSSLHMYNGQNHSMDLTLFHLLSHTSGLRDAIAEGSNEAKKRASHIDRPISFEETIQQTKQLQPHFEPGLGKRAHYANVNFEILGKIIEVVTGSTLADVYEQFIFAPLGLNNTYLPTDEDDLIPAVYYKDTSYHLPETIRSIPASGGCISTAEELMIFIKAFFGGRLFQETILQEMDVHNKLQMAMSPIHYGAGYMKIPMSGMVTLFMGKGELWGHSGSTGSFAFYHPASDLFFVGDVNQMVSPGLPVRLAMRLAMSA